MASGSHWKPFGSAPLTHPPKPVRLLPGLAPSAAEIDRLAALDLALFQQQLLGPRHPAAVVPDPRELVDPAVREEGVGPVRLRQAVQRPEDCVTVLAKSR